MAVEKIGYLIGKNGWRTKSIQTATNIVILHPVDRQNFFTIIGKYENIKQAEDTIDNMLQRSDEEHYKRLPKSTSNNRDNTYTDNRNVNYPNRYKNQKIECRYYQRGYCRFGKNCRFIHTEMGISNHVQRRRYNDLQRTHDREIRNQWQTVRSSRAMPTRRWHENVKPIYWERQRNDNKEDQWSNWYKDNQEQKTYNHDSDQEYRDEPKSTQPRSQWKENRCSSRADRYTDINYHGNGQDKSFFQSGNQKPNTNIEGMLLQILKRLEQPQQY